MKTPQDRASLSRRDFIGQVSLSAAAISLSSRLRAAEATPQKKLGIAIVGLGDYATRQIAPALKLTENCQLMGVVTGNPDTKGKQMQAAHGFPEKNIYTYETMSRIAENKDIDIVYVITPN